MEELNVDHNGREEEKKDLVDLQIQHRSCIAKNNTYI